MPSWRLITLAFALATEVRQSIRIKADAVSEALPQISTAVELIVSGLKNGGRLVYMGAGTSGRLGVLDASECPPTFGVEEGLVIGLIAGGDSALRKSSESCEDRPELGRHALMDIHLHSHDTVVAISASGYAPYCVGGLQYAKEIGAFSIALVWFKQEKSIIIGWWTCVHPIRSSKTEQSELFQLRLIFRVARLRHVLKHPVEIPKLRSSVIKHKCLLAQPKKL